MTESTRNRLPGAVYAVAGAGDLAYQKLRKLPAVLGGLTGTAAAGTADLREKALANSTGLRERAVAGTAELREAARRNAIAVVAGAHVVQQRATAVYEELVARGTRVIGRPTGPLGTPAQIESPDATALPTAPATAKPVRKATKRTWPKTGD